jgi:hypothetical protein
MPTGGAIASGTYYLTSWTEYYNPNLGPSMCGAPGSFTEMDTYRFSASSPTTGWLEEVLVTIDAEGGGTTQVYGVDYDASGDAGSALLHAACPIDSGSLAELAYTSTPTGIMAFAASYSGPFPGGQFPACYTVMTFAKQ